VRRVLLVLLGDFESKQYVSRGVGRVGTEDGRDAVAVAVARLQDASEQGCHGNSWIVVNVRVASGSHLMPVMELDQLVLVREHRPQELLSLEWDEEKKCVEAVAAFCRESVLVEERDQHRLRR
jgi:hypothetical protein